MDLVSSVGLKDPQAEIDLEGDVQGFASDEVARVLKEEHFHNFMVDAGGEIYAAGTNCAGHAWRIGVQDPDRRDRLMDAVDIGNAAVSTSGDYEKHIVIQGQKWSHIINPLTGYPQSGVASATVIAPTAVEADALSTALCILGPAAGLDLIKELGEGYDALILFRRDKEEYEWHSTPGYEDRRVDRNK
jgi:thiamine biosynthesis lipoprotein